MSDSAGDERSVTRRLVRILCTITASVAAGYLWAVAFGDGIAGLKGAYALNHSDSYPDANAAFEGAGAAYFVSLFGVAWGGVVTRIDLTRWIVLTVVAGGLLAVVSRVFA
jgi:hypothetical protein